MNMVSSEFNSMKTLYDTMPEIVAEPIAWGAYTEEPDTYFFICRFCKLSGKIPELCNFPMLLAEMHRRGVSPDGKFGMPFITYSGRNPQYFPPSDTWEECFSKGLRTVFAMEEETHGPDPELDELREGILTKVIPRLLRPLETEGRILTPRLVHGDLWDGNASVDVSTGSPKIFDGVCFYAHNEYELAPWFAPRHKMTDEYIAEYLKHFPASEPAEDFRDRGLLYRLRFDLHASSLYPGTLKRRGFAKDTMRELLAKFPLGYEEYRTRDRKGDKTTS
ncbi:Fructosamine/Ketosamine-3-kinase [Xylariomycetidae sp. FL2044]|nr:Fructosamine/Ketosamine-3-kinase [Xylariomycetidae sp. FL2044]